MSLTKPSLGRLLLRVHCAESRDSDAPGDDSREPKKRYGAGACAEGTDWKLTCLALMRHVQGEGGRQETRGGAAHPSAPGASHQGKDSRGKHPGARHHLRTPLKLFWTP